MSRWVSTLVTMAALDGRERELLETMVTLSEGDQPFEIQLRL